MKRVVAVAAAGAALFVLYHFMVVNAPVRQYRAFAEEILHRRYDAAAAMAEGMSADDLAKLGTQERIGSPAMFQTIFPSQYEIDSNEDGTDGARVIKSRQIVRFNPPGVESAMRPAMSVTLRQVTTLRKLGGKWKVVAFENSLVPPSTQ